MVKVLLIDDEPDQNLLNAKKLKMEGYEVFTADGGKKGLTMAKEIQPDIVFLDIIMIGQDGYEICQCLKSDPETKSIPVVFLTSTNDRHASEKAKQHHADGLIYKPATSRAFKQHIKDLVSQ